MRPHARPDRRPSRRRLTGIVALAVLAGAVVALLPAPSPVAAAGGCPVPLDRNGDCPVEKTLPVPGIPGPGRPGGTRPTGPGTPGPGGSSPDDGYHCEWHQYPDQEAWRATFPEAPPGSVFGEYHCFQDGRAIFGPYAPTWIPPDEGFGPAPLPPPSPAEVAADALLRVRALLEKPTVATNPPDPAPSTIGIPTFVSVPNWQGVLTPPDHCLRGVCVSLEAVPELTFDPGEPGADVIACEDGGTAFDRDGPDPEVQAAAPGACAYAYTRRTGVAGRPEAWTGEVAITWTVTWRAGPLEDTLDPITLSTTFGQAVEENRTVITDYSG
jgi:hypothetical protein